MSVIPMAECKKGVAYAIASRNLSYGVYDGDGGFVGLREKFGSIYPFTEYHYDQGAPFGTVRPYLELEVCPLEDLAEGHSDERFFHRNEPLHEWLTDLESRYDYHECMVKGGRWTQEESDKRQADEKRWREEYAQREAARAEKESDA